jgi:hypothetical protein
MFSFLPTLLPGIASMECNKERLTIVVIRNIILLRTRCDLYNRTSVSLQQLTKLANCDVLCHVTTIFSSFVSNNRRDSVYLSGLLNKK